MRRDFLKMAGGAALTMLLKDAFAAEWPDRPIKFIVPYTPGGGTDAVSRILTTSMSRQNKWTLVVDNKPGANGGIGMEAVQKALPDGYSIGMGQMSNLALNPWLYSRLSYDVTGISTVALVCEQPLILVTNANSGIKTLADLTKLSKSRPEGLTHALAGAGSLGQMAAELLKSRLNIKVLNVPYKGASPALTELLGGGTDFMFGTPPAVLSMTKSNKLTAIAVTSSKRLPLLPDVPTIAELGYPGFDVVDWKAVVAPKGTPDSVIKSLNAAVNKALQMPEVASAFAAEGNFLTGGDSDKAEKFVASERAKWGEIIKKASIKLE